VTAPDGTWWMCGAFQPTDQPYRCTRPYDHDGDHQAVLDGLELARWPRRMDTGAGQ
jgi:hypothetical protein